MAKFDLKKAILENKATFFSSLTEGQFSWMTQDTGQQIGSQDENQIPVFSLPKAKSIPLSLSPEPPFIWSSNS